MSDWSHNHTIFVGPKDVLDAIANMITSEGIFDFNQIFPTPKVFDTYGAPVNVIDDAEFAAKYNLEQAPTTIKDFTALAQGFTIATDAEGDARKLHDIPVTVHNIIADTYGCSNWYAWRIENWGTKWVGKDAEATRHHDNLLVVTYDTAWNPPEGIFDALRETYENLHIINGSDVEGFGEGIEAYRGDLASFLAYFTVSSRNDVNVYEYHPNNSVKDPNNAEGSGEGSNAGDVQRDAALLYHTHCTVNEINIYALIAAGLLIGENEKIIKISDLEKAL